ncbi:AraC family transcriptional regulator [Mucilaginibacter panaciglaebae]|uniref:HTH araC/xylS-type domain-containing protein n=1 Tax=Mucilaginibacter panaciglaebae TaxID=502331 RepID=A0ABP7X5N0_9SPHI
MVVKSELEKLGMYCITVETGQVEVLGNLSDHQLRYFKAALLNAGLELIEDRKKILIERIKAIVLDMIDNSDYPLKTNFSLYLSEMLNLDYTYLANVFSAMQGITVEHFIIANKIRRVKELICAKELNLTEISWKLNYSSVAHLSTQFKKVTGVTPSHFKYIECAGTLLPAMCEL